MYCKSFKKNVFPCPLAEIRIYLELDYKWVIALAAFQFVMKYRDYFNLFCSLSLFDLLWTNLGNVYVEDLTH